DREGGAVPPPVIFLGRMKDEEKRDAHSEHEIGEFRHPAQKLLVRDSEPTGVQCGDPFSRQFPDKPRARHEPVTFVPAARCSMAVKVLVCGSFTAACDGPETAWSTEGPRVVIRADQAPWQTRGDFVPAHVPCSTI